VRVMGDKQIANEVLFMLDKIVSLAAEDASSEPDYEHMTRLFGELSDYLCQNGAPVIGQTRELDRTVWCNNGEGLKIEIKITLVEEAI